MKIRLFSPQKEQVAVKTIAFILASGAYILSPLPWFKLILCVGMIVVLFDNQSHKPSFSFDLLTSEWYPFAIRTIAYPILGVIVFFVLASLFGYF